ncbi:MAG: hypothetical protein D6761_01690 [Candidatus Dadabacteria bacterium]|nr:MAG: hypothetical protein D6761_01690 [Candidatus Dadabacteria bacterium]
MAHSQSRPRRPVNRICVTSLLAIVLAGCAGSVRHWTRGVQPADDPQAARQIAAAADASGDLERAIAETRAALAATPNDPDLIADLGARLLRSGNPVAARRLLQRQQRRYPEHARLRIWAGWAAWMSGDDRTLRRDLRPASPLAEDMHLYGVWLSRTSPDAASALLRKVRLDYAARRRPIDPDLVADVDCRLSTNRGRLRCPFDPPTDDVP